MSNTHNKLPEWKLRPDTQRHFNNILDTMTGGNGNFPAYKVWIEELDRMAADGYKTAEEILNVMIRFSRLINTANGMTLKDEPAWLKEDDSFKG